MESNFRHSAKYLFVSVGLGYYLLWSTVAFAAGKPGGGGGGSFGGGGGSSAGGGKGMRIQVELGLSSQQFAGASSKVSQIVTYDYGLGFFYIAGSGWSNGFRYSSLSGASINPFTLQGGTSGKYSLAFTRYDFLTGYHSGDLHFHILYGAESVAWAGTPDLAQVQKFDYHYGLQLTWDIEKLGAKGIKLPLVFEYLTHPTRVYTFNNYPFDTVTISGGGELILNVGAAFEF